MRQKKTANDSLTVYTDLVLPSHSNSLGNMFGGELLSRMDRACSISASRHSNAVSVTANVNHVDFKKAVPVGSFVTIEAKVSRAFNTSMEVYCDVYCENALEAQKQKVYEGIFTFVAIDSFGKPIQIPELVPKTEIEKERFNGALRRKQLSLLIARKIKPSEAIELKSLFDINS